MQFEKMHGLGNDFVVVDGLEDTSTDWAALARRVGDRRFGVGCDQLLVVLPSAVCDWRMVIHNPDGSEAEMCGNGIRCFLKYLRDHQLETRDECTVETLAGTIIPRMVADNGSAVARVAVDMGRPTLTPADIPFEAPGDRAVRVPLRLAAGEVAVTAVSMGNPHGVIVVDDLAATPWEALGAEIQRHPRWPRSVNVEFVQVNSPRELTMRVTERGAGRTLACGTGACASTVACVLGGLTEREVTVHLEGGDLHIAWREDDHVIMTGSATSVFRGELI